MSSAPRGLYGQLLYSSHWAAFHANAMQQATFLPWGWMMRCPSSSFSATNPSDPTAATRLTDVLASGRWMVWGCVHRTSTTLDGRFKGHLRGVGSVPNLDLQVGWQNILPNSSMLVHKFIIVCGHIGKFHPVCWSNIRSSHRLF